MGHLASYPSLLGLAAPSQEAREGRARQRPGGDTWTLACCCPASPGRNPAAGRPGSRTARAADDPSAPVDPPLGEVEVSLGRRCRGKDPPAQG